MLAPPVPVPSDVYEPTFSITGGTANAVITFGTLFLIGSGVKWYPIVQSVTLDANGNGTVTCTANVIAPLGAATVGTSYSWSTPLPSGLPSTATCTASPLSTSGEFARQFAQLIGPATQAVDGSRIAEDYRTLAKALAMQSATLDTLVGDMFPDTATDLVSKWESFLGLISNPNLSLTQRQQNLLAKWRALIGGQPKVINAALQTIDPSGLVAEWTTTQIGTISSGLPYAVQTAMQRRVFMFSVYLSAANVAAILRGGTNQIILLLQQMMPVYANFYDPSAGQGQIQVIAVGTQGTGGVFECDDPASLTDQTLLAT